MDRDDSLSHANNEAPKAGGPKIEPIYPWKKAWETLKVIWPQLIYISLVCMSIPQYLLFIFSTQKAAKLSTAFKINQPILLEKGIRVLSEFAAHFVSIGWLVAILYLLGVFTVVALCGQVSRSEPISTGQALKAAARALFPKGVFFLLALVLIGLFLLNVFVQIFSPQLMKFAGLIFAVLLSALPALMVIEPKRPMQAFRTALKMRYTEFTGMSKWSVFFLLLTYLLIAMNLVALIELTHSALLQLDILLNVNREHFFFSSEDWPFGKAIYFVEAVSAVMLGLLTLIVTVLNGSLLYELYRRHTVGRHISIVV